MTAAEQDQTSISDVSVDDIKQDQTLLISCVVHTLAADIEARMLVGPLQCKADITARQQPDLAVVPSSQGSPDNDNEGDTVNMDCDHENDGHRQCAPTSDNQLLQKLELDFYLNSIDTHLASHNRSTANITSVVQQAKFEPIETLDRELLIKLGMPKVTAIGRKLEPLTLTDPIPSASAAKALLSSLIQ